MIDAKFKWELADNAPSLTVDNLEKELGISIILATLLAQQGIDSTEQAKKFFEPSMEEIHDPTLLHDMDKAVERIEQAVEKQEQITIYGDYDADGITSTSLMYETLLSSVPMLIIMSQIGLQMDMGLTWTLTNALLIMVPSFLLRWIMALAEKMLSIR